ncbi:MAG: hypothetical protein QXX94_07185 [Candidatus Bathyarchaeia archaeon]
MSENRDSKIEEIEKEIREIKSTISQINEIASTVEDLKKALIDMRSTINEMENPFNLLKLITDEEGLAKVNEAKPIIEGIVKEKEVEREKPPEKILPKMEAEPEKPVEEIDEVKIKEEFEKKPLTITLDFKRTISLVEWIYTMLDIGFDEDGIRKICEYSEFFGFIPKGSAAYISNLAGAIKNAKSSNITEDVFTLSIYNIANIMGVKINWDGVAELIKNFLRSRRLNGAWSKGWGSQ